jgi:intraflagellar transport protein 172
MATDESAEMYTKEAAELEAQGRYKEAEQLYLAVQQPNKAIAMYKSASLWDDMIRLVEQVHPDHLQVSNKEQLCVNTNV